MSADGVLCPIIRPDVVVVRGEVGELWPLTSDEYPIECRKGPPTAVTFEIAVITPDGGAVDHLIADVLWTGADVVAALEIPADFVVPATATPTMTPAEFPPTGGVTTEGDRDVFAVPPAFALAVAGGLALVRFAARPTQGNEDR